MYQPLGVILRYTGTQIIQTTKYITMRNLFLLIFLLSVFANGFSQDLKKITKRLPYFTETYFVLEKNKNVKHGKYYMISYGDTIKCGYYKNNIRSGNWKYYSGKNLEFIFDFDNNKIITDTLGRERPALYSEGFTFFQIINALNIKYPPEAVEAGHSGKVVISFKVGIDGIVSDFEVYEGCGDIALNEEALRVVKKVALEETWHPAINDKGEKISSLMTKNVIFQIQ